MERRYASGHGKAGCFRTSNIAAWRASRVRRGAERTQEIVADSKLGASLFLVPNLVLSVRVESELRLNALDVRGAPRIGASGRLGRQMHRLGLGSRHAATTWRSGNIRVQSACSAVPPY
jgi:hypothetical protein